MDLIRRAGPRVRNVAAGLFCALLMAGCVAADTGSPSADGGASDQTGTVAQPKLATYSCGEDGSITVENLGDAVRVLGTDGAAIDLPAAPPTQRARFGGENQAIVLEDGEALYMVAGKPTLSCRQG